MHGVTLRATKEIKVAKNKETVLKWYDPLLLGLIPPCGAFFIKTLTLSCRKVIVVGQEEAEHAAAKAGGKAIYVTWHQRMFYHFHYFGSRHVTMMISQSRDGEYAARVASWLGFRNVRGSSTRGGTLAMRKLIREIRRGETAGMLADGPLGPPRVAKIGSVILAKETGAPVVPVLWGADRCWVFNTWDQYLVPKPFARVAIRYQKPIWVPAEASHEDLEEYRLVLEKELNEGTLWCDEFFGVQRPWRKERKR